MGIRGGRSSSFLWHGPEPPVEEFGETDLVEGSLQKLGVHLEWARWLTHPRKSQEDAAGPPIVQTRLFLKKKEHRFTSKRDAAPIPPPFETLPKTPFKEWENIQRIDGRQGKTLSKDKPTLIQNETIIPFLDCPLAIPLEFSKRPQKGVNENNEEGPDTSEDDPLFYITPTKGLAWFMMGDGLFFYRLRGPCQRIHVNHTT
ncbi:unnamed protein product [Larinioides sclopetarius]|uniref:Uncharacterized protein n=1 Tax=Larinioides sclopetarius TaxID=280406 RepID=A0AAV2B083_9ARAC